MNFLSKTFSSLTGPSIPYSFKDKNNPLASFNISRSLWTVYEGTNSKNENAPVTIFEYDLTSEFNRRSGFEIVVRNSFKKLKQIKHPFIVSTIDFIENENYLYIITEPVASLVSYLESNELSVEAKLLGIYQIGEALSFLHSRCHCVHGNLNAQSSIFVNETGNWKLFGFEILTNVQDESETIIQNHAAKVPDFMSEVPESSREQEMRVIQRFPMKFDSYLFGLFIQMVLTLLAANLKSSTKASNLKTSSISKNLDVLCKRLLNNNPTLRPPIEKFMKEAHSNFSQNEVFILYEQLEELKFKSDENKRSFFKLELPTFMSCYEKYSWRLLSKKLLPELITQFLVLSKQKPSTTCPQDEFQDLTETLSNIFHYILRIGCQLDSETFSKQIKPIIFTSFALPDRSIRLNLLTHLPAFASFLTESDVQSQIFYPMLTGFQDTNFMIRESTLKSFTAVIDKVSVKQINQEMLKLLAKSQVDPKPSIRTNTIVMIVKIGDKIYKSSRNSVLISALSKALRDSFTPCKLAALSGFESLCYLFSLHEICSKVLGQIAVALMDERSYKVRTEAKRVFDLYVNLVENHAAAFPKEEIDEDFEEKEFYEKNTHVPESTRREEKNLQSSSMNTNFGWKAVNKLISSSAVAGDLNNNFNRSTPALNNESPPVHATVSSTILEDKQDADFANWDAADSTFEDLDNWTDGQDTLIPLKENNSKSFGSQTTSYSNSETKSALLGHKTNVATTKSPGATLSIDLQDDDDTGWDDAGW